MTKQIKQKTKWKAGNMIYPLPAAMVSCGNEEKPNIVTVAWTGTICTNPAMTYISLRPSRYSYDLIKESGYFVINLTTRPLVYATDYCGVKSGRDVNKFQEMKLTAVYDENSGCPMIGESPVSVVCKTTEIKELGSHHMFIAMVESVYIDESYMDEQGKFHLNQTDLIAYSHGTYLSLGEELGTFGYSIKKKNTAKGERERKATSKVNEPLKEKKITRNKENQSFKQKSAGSFSKKKAISKKQKSKKKAKK